ncbi:MAG: TAXI family TRAP transporter solute-binding subunit [Rhodospirillaceae bacterium]|nr:MAG: TAXI family TRAP transporter solute-binding subunit [Rhodospirillaceae bacterium]
MDGYAYGDCSHMTRLAGTARWLAIVVMVGAMLSGCDQDPSPGRLKNDLESALTTTVPAGLLTLQSAEIVGIARPESVTTRGERVVHFVATVRLNRDTAFSTWDQYGAAALADAFGAMPDEIGGITARGNTTGDILTIPGTATYEYDASGAPEPWRLRAFHAAPGQSFAAPSSLQYLGNLVAIAGTVPETWKLIAENLTWPPTRALALVARTKGGFALAGGVPGSDGWKVVEALRRSQPDSHPIVNLVADGPIESLRLARDKTATAVIIDSDTAALAAAGSGIFAASGPYENLRAVASLYPKPIHVIVGENSRVNSVADLRDKRIVIVASNSGTTQAAEDVLRAHRLPSTLPETTISHALPEAMDALAAGTIDAIVTAVAAPYGAIAATAMDHPFRLLSLDSDAIALLTSGETHYIALSIPGRTYRGQQNAVATVAVAAILAADRDVRVTEVNALLQSVFGPVDYLRLGSAAGIMISPNTAQLGLPLPLHPGAEAFFKTSSAAPSN